MHLPADYIIQSVAFSQLVKFGSGVDHLRQQVNEQRDVIALVKEEGDEILKNILFERGSLKVRVDATASQLLGTCSSLMLVH